MKSVRESRALPARPTLPHFSIPTPRAPHASSPTETSPDGSLVAVDCHPAAELPEHRAMPIVRQIQVGGATKAELLGRLTRAGVELNAAAQTLFADQRFQPLPEATTLQCIELDVADLGLMSGGTFADIKAAAAAQGWSDCPLELGPQLRLRLLDQPEGAAGVPETRHCAPPGSITIASAPLDDEDETPKGFYLRRIDGTLWLRGYRSWPGHVWDPGDRFIFVSLRGTSETTC